jgi:hypothetical protein
MVYDNAGILKTNAKYAEIKDNYKYLILKLSVLNNKLKSNKAQEYLMQGAGRRIVILSRCINNIFKIFPLEKTEFLSKNELTDLAINLHAFFVNISGILDNLGWVYIYENNLLGRPKEGKVSRHGVGLFNEKTQEHLNQQLKAYFTSSNIKDWYKNYSKNYRDALAHRVPLYVPPKTLNNEEAEEYLSLEKSLWDFSSPDNIEGHDRIREKQSQLGKPCYFFAHSLMEDGQPVLLHAQIITDFITIEEIVEKFCVYFNDV